jgi:hypothetical protein
LGVVPFLKNRSDISKAPPFVVNVKFKLPLCLIKYHAVNMYVCGKAEVKLHAVLNLAPDEG